MVTRQSAIQFGATGLTGGFLLHKLLGKPDYSTITAAVGRDNGITHTKPGGRFADRGSGLLLFFRLFHQSAPALIRRAETRFARIGTCTGPGSGRCYWADIKKKI